jgi:excisionase family DNA binding protein
MKRGATRPGPEPRANEGIRNEITTLQEVADYLNCHYTTVYRLARDGTLPAFYVGRRYRVRWDELEKWIEQQRVVLASMAVGPKPKVAKARPKSKA